MIRGLRAVDEPSQGRLLGRADAMTAAHTALFDGSWVASPGGRSERGTVGGAG